MSTSPPPALRPRPAARRALGLLLAAALLGGPGCAAWRAWRSPTPAPAPGPPPGPAALPPPVATVGPPPVLIEPPRPGVPRGVVTDGEKPAWMRSLVLPTDLPLRWYPKVSAFLELYRNDPRYREIVRGWIKRLPQHRRTLETVLAREGVPPGLLFVAMIESGFSASALSNRGAGGFWQFKTGIGRGYGLEISFWVDERRDLEKSTTAAALYFGDLYERFGSWELALAGYNAGYYAVLTSIQRFNTNDYFTLCQLESGLPWETTEYVPKVLAVAIVERNRRAFGIEETAAEPPREVEPLSAPPGVPFDRIAARLGVNEDELAQLNPAYLRRRTPPDRGPVVLRVPRGRARSLDDLRPGDLVAVKVRPGETLARVAKAHRVARDRLRKINGVTDDADVVPGTVLMIPRAARPAAKAKPRR